MSKYGIEVDRIEKYMRSAVFFYLNNGAVFVASGDLAKRNGRWIMELDSDTLDVNGFDISNGVKNTDFTDIDAYDDNAEKQYEIFKNSGIDINDEKVFEEVKNEVIESVKTKYGETEIAFMTAAEKAEHYIDSGKAMDMAFEKYVKKMYPNAKIVEVDIPGGKLTYLEGAEKREENTMVKHTGLFSKCKKKENDSGKNDELLINRGCAL